MDTHPHTQPQPPRGKVVTGPLRTDDDILARVDELIGPEDRRRHSLWLFFFDREMRQMPVVVPIDDVPDRPDPQLVGNTCWIITQVLADTEPGGSAVIALTRPGPAKFGAIERHWHSALVDQGRRHGTPLRMLCLATSDGTRELAPPDPCHRPVTHISARSRRCRPDRGRDRSGT
jgi:hypothetical protein